jgi:hypothetical protein
VSSFEQAAILIPIMMSGYPASGEAAVDRFIRQTNLGHYSMKVPCERTKRHPGGTNPPTTFSRRLRRLPDFERLWLDYRTSSAEASFTESNAASRQNRSDLQVRTGREMATPGGRIAP